MLVQRRDLRPRRRRWCSTAVRSTAPSGPPDEPGTSLLTLAATAGRPASCEVAHGTPWTDVLGADELAAPCCSAATTAPGLRPGALADRRVSRAELAAARPGLRRRDRAAARRWDLSPGAGRARSSTTSPASRRAGADPASTGFLRSPPPSATASPDAGPRTIRRGRPARRPGRRARRLRPPRRDGADGALGAARVPRGARRPRPRRLPGRAPPTRGPAMRTTSPTAPASAQPRLRVDWPRVPRSRAVPRAAARGRRPRPVGLPGGRAAGAGRAGAARP